MSKSKALIAAETKIAALEARIELATIVWRDQKAQIAALEAALNTRGVKPAAIKHQPVPVVTRFTKADGSVWEKIRTGNTARSHQVQ